MKINSLNLMGRLSRIRDEQAGEAVKTQRAVVDQMREQARMLAEYRRSMSLSKASGREQNGQSLRARGAFMDVADNAVHEVRQQLAGSEEELKRALYRWADTRQRRRVLEANCEIARRKADREREKKAEKDRPQSQRKPNDD